ncbi:MAG: class I SAM-dependent methyltransferase [Ruminococcaceae bacterium]|nr:class I SAM-dependent methyltransferase [Oscillospiraceae bacterium]
MYQAIAAFYNNNIGDTNYDHMANFLHEVFYEYNKTGNSDEKPIVLDAGCGTGSCAVKLADKGFDVIGLDISPEMLQKAQEQPGSDKVQWICQDMTDMDLFGTVQAVFSMTDSVNHLLEEEELQGFFNGASLFTEKGGLLVFDFLTEKYFTQIIDGNVFCQEDEDSCLVWSGEVENGFCYYDITCFEREDKHFTRSQDCVTERMWSVPELECALKEAGYSVVSKFSDVNRTPCKKGDFRRYYVCRKVR